MFNVQLDAILKALASFKGTRFVSSDPTASKNLESINDASARTVSCATSTVATLAG